MPQVPLNPAFNLLQITSALNHLGTTHLIINAETNLPYKAPRPIIPLMEHLILDLKSTKLESMTIPTLKKIIVVDNSDGRVDTSELKALDRWEDVARDGEGEKPADRDLGNDEIINIQFTSGTTSMP